MNIGKFIIEKKYIIIGAIISMFILMCCCCGGVFSNIGKGKNSEILEEVKVKENNKKTLKYNTMEITKPTETPTITVTATQTPPLIETPTSIKEIENNLGHSIGGKLSELEKYLNEKSIEGTVDHTGGEYLFKRNKILVYSFDNLVYDIYIDYESKKQKISKEDAYLVAKSYLPDDAVLIKKEDVSSSDLDGQTNYYYKSKKLMDTKVNDTGELIIIIQYTFDEGVFQTIIGEGNNP